MFVSIVPSSSARVVSVAIRRTSCLACDYSKSYPVIGPAKLRARSHAAGVPA
jgi:hypothetical protein